MDRVTRDDMIRYKEDMLKPETGFSHRNIKHHLDDLKTLFRYAANVPRRTDTFFRLK